MVERSALRPVRWVFGSIVRPAQLVLRRVLSTTIDRSLDVVTTDERVAAELGHDIDHFRRTWRSLGWMGTWRLLRHLRASPTEVLLDVGCGAGRVVVGAMGQPFGRTIGIEIDDAFARLASRNVATRRRARSRAKIIVADATTYVIPAEVTLVYLYNPFRGPVFAQFLAQIVASHAAHPREIKLVYANPVEDGVVLATGAFEPVGSFLLAWRPTKEWARTQRVNVYRVSSAGGVATPRRADRPETSASSTTRA